MKSLFVILGAGLLVLLPVLCGAQGVAPYTYAVKFVCGEGDGKILSKAYYKTAINVCNPTDTKMGFRKKFSVALPKETAGPVSDFVEGRLGPYESLEIDCPDIRNHLKLDWEFLKGFVIIESKVKLNIVAVYTVADLDGEVKSIDVEQVHPFHAISSNDDCPDLIIEKINEPIKVEKIKGYIVEVFVKNIGTSSAAESSTRIIYMANNTGVDVEAWIDLPTSSLAPGESVRDTFALNNWTYKSGTILNVMADAKNMIQECREDNNTKVFPGGN